MASLLDFVEDIGQGAIDVLDEVAETAMDKPLTTLFTGGISVVSELAIENVVRPLGRELEQKGGELISGIGGLFDLGRGESPVNVSLVEDAQLPTQDPRGTRGTRGTQPTTQTASILTPTAEQPTLLG